MEPNAPSVVPARVTFRVDLRHPDGVALDLLGARFEAICAAEAAPCGLTLTRLVDAPPNGFDAGLMAKITAAAARHAIPAMPILSAAGHDARHLAKVCPSAMIFIPCRDGVSHAEHEFAEPAHLAAGTQVLADVLGALVSEETAS
jgi:N-carbamoyl-L-amino-acid hydrolase